MYEELYENVFDAKDQIERGSVKKSVATVEARRILTLARWQEKTIDLLLDGRKRTFAVGKLLLTVLA